jgi:hypothetical protein
MPGEPAQVMAAWRAQPPEALQPFKLTDESYNSLSYALRYYDWPQKLLFVTTLGLALIFAPFMGSYFNLTVRFDEGAAQTKVTIVGHAHPRTREQLSKLAEEHGGTLAGRLIV